MSHVNVRVGCVPPIKQFRLCGMQKSFGAERFDSLDESWAIMEAEPSGVAVPSDVEAVGADPVETWANGASNSSPRFSESRSGSFLARRNLGPLRPDFTLLQYILGQLQCGALPQPVCAALRTPR
jgi:hypothetical protein